MKHSSGLFFILLIFLIIGFGFVLAGGSKSVQQQPDYTHITPLPNGTTVSLDTKGNNDTTNKNQNQNQSTSIEQQKNLQLRELTYVTPVPTTPPPATSTSTTCTKQFPFSQCDRMGSAYLICENSGCADDGFRPPGGGCEYTFGEAAQKHACDANCHQECGGEKPVIYLYPTKPTRVSVKITGSEKVTVSDPLYPSTGWNDILADPNGTFRYKNKTYQELFYESTFDMVKEPMNGYIVPIEQASETLKNMTKRLGLTSSEQQELLDYWIPRLTKLSMPYLKISLLDQKEKDRLDSFSVTPKPDTIIAFMLYFKPLLSPLQNPSAPLHFPQTVPQRRGFTVVEWGGTVDN